jgi:hypothetical protein
MTLWNKTDAELSKPKWLNAEQKAKCFFVSADEALLKVNKLRGIKSPGWWIVTQFEDSFGATRYRSECIASVRASQTFAGDANDDDIVADIETLISISQQPVSTISASRATATATVTGGIITAITMVNGGTGYNALDAFTGVSPAVSVVGAGAGAVLTPVIVNGVITALTITNAGTGYTTAPTITIAPPTSTLSVTAISTPPGNNSLLTYKWQYKAPSGSWTNVVNGTTASIPVALATNNNTKFRVKISSTNGATPLLSTESLITYITA